MVLEDRARLGLRDPGAELDLAEPGRLDADRARHADHAHARTRRSGAVGWATVVAPDAWSCSASKASMSASR